MFSFAVISIMPLNFLAWQMKSPELTRPLSIDFSKKYLANKKYFVGQNLALVQVETFRHCFESWVYIFGLCIPKCGADVSGTDEIIGLMSFPEEAFETN